MNYESNKHLVRYADLKYARAAFIDARIPGSHLKENYCIVGKGVSQDSRQPVHIYETDGFHLGAAGQPPNILNSLHSHRSAEIFMVYKGTFRIYWGPDAEHEALLGPGDMITVPVHCFRGFEVVGIESGFMFVALGGDDCGGGIIFHPSIVSEGQKYGLYLKKDNTLADTVVGDPIPEASELFTPLTREEVEEFDDYTVEEMMCFVSLKNERTPRESSFTGSGTFNYYHVSGHPDHPDAFEVGSEDGVSIYAYEIPEGGYVPMHKRVENQILVNLSGDVKLTFSDPELMPIILGPGDTYDLPKEFGVELEGIRETCYIYCMVGGDDVSAPIIL